MGTTADAAAAVVRAGGGIRGLPRRPPNDPEQGEDRQLQEEHQVYERPPHPVADRTPRSVSTPLAAPPQAAGLFGPGTLTWRVNRELVLLLGGGRALLLQVAHPLVAAGVRQHSDYDTDPWGRLYRTLDLTTKIVFGDGRTSAAASRRLQAVHARVRGEAPDGTPYDARDRDLLLWVWATLVDSSLLVYRRCVRELTAEELDRYYGEQTRFAAACGVPEGHWPADYASFVTYFEGMVARGLRVDEDARAIARSVLRPPLPAPLRPFFFSAVNLVTAGLLPAPLRAAYGLPWSSTRDRMLAATLGAVRRALPLMPAPARQFPEARAAARRVALSRAA
jgi:uncharacterized protein (DUF2236 family)